MSARHPRTRELIERAAQHPDLADLAAAARAEQDRLDAALDLVNGVAAAALAAVPGKIADYMGQLGVK